MSGGSDGVHAGGPEDHQGRKSASIAWRQGHRTLREGELVCRSGPRMAEGGVQD